MDPRLVHIVRAARKGGKVLKRYFGESLETSVKSSLVDLRTKADLESEQEILQVLRAEFPDYNIWSEELGHEDHDSPYTFVIDPLDGTNNFTLGLPTFSVSIALLHHDTTMLGVVYSPFLEGAYYAQRGLGAYFDGAPLMVSGEKALDKATIAISAGYGTPREFNLNVTRRLVDAGAKRVLDEWSTPYCLCLIAAGRMEGMISSGAEFYDIAAAKLIASEAGLVLTDFDGNREHDDHNNNFIAGSTKELHQLLVDINRDGAAKA